MAGRVEATNEGAVRILWLDNPPVNGLGASSRAGLLLALEQALESDAVEAIVICGKGNMFCAGADIREFGKDAPKDTPELPAVIDAFENSRKPTVAALHGVAAGGGLELALGCHARIAARGARLGLPEVTLGIIPGAGGTQRLPRLIGVRQALELIVSGKLLAGEKAAELGVIDEQTDEANLVTRAVARASELAASGEPLRRTSHLTEALDDAARNGSLFEDFEKSIRKKARGFEAPYAAIEAVRAAVEATREEGFRVEREIFWKLVDSDQARAQRHVFFAERGVWKIPDVPKETPKRSIERVGVIGFGTMGSGIAMCFADAGLPVTVVESDEKALDRGFEKVRGSYASSVSKGRFSQQEMDRRLSRIEGALDYSSLGGADLVVEAVFEDLEVKQDVFRRLDEACRDDAILATNTSTLDVDAIASVVSHPEKVMGTHFFSPAHIMKLMENVRGARTSKETVATVMSLSKRLNKVGVLVGVCDGFVGNRMLYAYRRQADFLLEEGALPHEVDQALYDFGLPMGPFAMADMAGLDIGWAVRKSQAANRPEHLRYSPIADRICERGRFGQKTGAGWYRYEKGSRTPLPDPEIESLIVSVSEEFGIERRPISSEEIVQRCIYALINEGAKILDEGIALRSSDVDIVWIYGYGFPRYRGGPMFYADTVGVKHVYDTVSRFYDEQGEWMKPAPLLQRLAKEGKGFGENSGG